MKLQELRKLIREELTSDPIIQNLARAEKERHKKTQDSYMQRFSKPSKSTTPKGRVYGKKREDLDWKLFDLESELKQLIMDKKQLYRDMDVEAGIMGDEWGDDQANVYGEKMNILDDQIEDIKNQIDIIQNKLNI